MIARLVLVVSLVLLTAPGMAYAEVAQIETFEETVPPLVDDEVLAQLLPAATAACSGAVYPGRTVDLPPAGPARARVFRPPRA